MTWFRFALFVKPKQTQQTDKSLVSGPGIVAQVGFHCPEDDGAVQRLHQKTVEMFP